MRASRLLSILMLLQSRGRLSATALARELEVSVRTILRDMDELSASGVPVFADRGREGGFQLREGWSTQLTGLTDAESQALFLAGIPHAAQDLGLGNASASARLKMLSALPESMRDTAIRTSTLLHFDPIDWFRAASPTTHLQTVASAIWQQKILHVRYESWNATKDHALKPLGLVFKAGTWYFVAMVVKSQSKSIIKEGIPRKKAHVKATAQQMEPKMFRLSNLLSAQLSTASFVRPRKFDLSKFWSQATQRFESQIYTGVATVRVSKLGFKLLRELSPTIAASAVRHAVTDPACHNWIQTTVPTESVAHAGKQFLGIGEDLEVLAPLELRVHIQLLLKLLSSRYLT